MTNKLPAPIAELPSPSVLETRNFLHLKASLMSPNVVPYAAQPKNRAYLGIAIITVVAVTEAEMAGLHRGRCSRLNAPHAAKTLKYLLNPVVVGRSTVRIVTAKQTQ